MRWVIGGLVAFALYGYIAFLFCFGHDLRPWIYRAIFRRTQP